MVPNLTPEQYAELNRLAESRRRDLERMKTYQRNRAKLLKELPEAERRQYRADCALGKRPPFPKGRVTGLKDI